MSSISRSHAVRPHVTAPVPVESLTQPVRIGPQTDPVRGLGPAVAERVPAAAHVAGGAAGVDLTSSAAAPAADGDALTPSSGIRFLGAGWAADAALFAQYRRRSN